MSGPLTYLAVPYSHRDPTIRAERFAAVNRVAAKLMRDGILVFSPISHSHPIAEAGDLPGDFHYWEAFDRAYLAHCCKVIVLRLLGWEQSVGVQAEIRIATELGIPVEYMDA